MRLRSIRLAPLIGFLVVIAAAGVLVARQPVSAPWWVNGDADATYAASALSILAGHRTNLIDHPGLPEQELLAVSFGAASLTDGGPTESWAADEMLHLDRARPIYRGWAIAFFVGGAGLAFLLLTRLLGHWTWGAAAGLLWLAQPGLTDSIQIRPDVVLAGLALVAGFLATRAFERRSALWLVFAAVVTGFALMVKLPAVALLVSLLLARVFGYPAAGWPTHLRHELRDWLVRHRLSVGITAGLWLALAIALNARAPTPHPAPLGLLALLAAGIGVLGYLAAGLFLRGRTQNRVALRLIDPLFAVIVVAVAIGVFIPGGLLVGDWLRSLRAFASTLAGGNVNQGVTPFGTSLSILKAFPLRQALVLFVVAGAATIWGVRRRNAWPAIWFAAAAVAGVMAAARLAPTRYFALPYVLSIPPALWVFRRRARAATPLLVWVLVAYIVVPTFQNSREDARFAHAQEALAVSITRTADGLLKPGEAALVPNDSPLPDARWWELVETFTSWHPAYPYRFIDETGPVAAVAEAHHLRVRYYIGPLASASAGPLNLVSGVYDARPVPGSPGVVELLAGPGT